MTDLNETKFARKMQLISQLSGILTFFIGLLSIAAWATGAPILSAFKVMPAFPFMLAGLAVCGLQARKFKSAIHIAGLGLALILMCISGHDLADMLMASTRDSMDAMTGGFAFSLLNSLAANDALSLLLISVALLCVDLPSKQFRLADFFTIVAAFMSMMTLLGVIFGIPGFCVFISCLRISLLEGLTIALLALGVLFIRPEQGLASIMSRDTAGGVLARRLLPAAVILPLILGWLRMEGERLKLYTSEIGLTLLVAMLVLIFLTVIGWNAWSIDRMDRARLKAIDEMEEEIARRKEVEQRFKDFYSNVSHELRSPLTSIQGSLQLIDHTIDAKAGADIKELVSTADISCARLIRLINDLLDVKQIEEGKLTIKVKLLDTLEVTTAAVDGLKGMAHDAGVSLTVVMDALGFVMADEDRLIQVLTNFISNAIKFSKAGDVVIIKTSQPNAQRMRFSVKDNGPGIPDNERHKIFGKFEKIEAQDGLQRKGTGLGLAISKGIVEEHGGTIGFDTEIGKGTEFWFELPSGDQSFSDQSSADKSSPDKLSADKSSPDKSSADKSSADKSSPDQSFSDQSSADKSSATTIDPLLTTQKVV